MKIIKKCIKKQQGTCAIIWFVLKAFLHIAGSLRLPISLAFDAYGAEYTFSQVYDGVRVFGRNVTVSANSADEGDFIASSVVPSARLAESNLNFTYSKSQAENSAKGHYSGSFDVREDATEKVIFTLFGYENNPVPAYVVSVYGVDDDGEYVDDNTFVNALNGDVIFASTNIHDFNTRTANDELGNPRTFPVVSERSGDETIYYMRSPDVNGGGVELYNHIHLPPFQATYGNNDAQQISAYANMIDVMKWWKASFDRNSLDGNGMLVKVVAHQHLFAEKDDDGNVIRIARDNACWSPRYRSIFVYDNSETEKRSCAAAVDVMAHESTHAVIEYRIGYDFSNFYVCYLTPTGNGLATGAINEGYADIFGCLMTGQWKYSLHVHSNDEYERNIENPRDSNAQQNARAQITAPARMSQVWCPTADIIANGFRGENDNGGVHINSSIVSYPAYLMYKNGLTWNELAQLWYKSMRMGYSCISTFGTVRTCVVRAARKLGMSQSKIDVIEQAFEEVGIIQQPAILKGKVSKYGGEGLPNVSVKATRYYASFGRSITGRSYTAQTNANGDYSLNLPEGTYSIDISVSGYVPFYGVKAVEQGIEYELNIPLVTPTGAHTSTITGTVRDALTSYPVGGGVLKVWEGWNVHTGYTVAETLIDDDGTYTLPLFAGYYTAEFRKEGYITTSINNFVIPSDATLKRDIIHSTAVDGKYRVTLQWDRKPEFLDSHLIGQIKNGTGSYETFHVYYVTDYRTAYDASGNVIAMIEQDDTRSYGFETITFEMKPFDKFKYYVHWWSRDDSITWTGTNAVVNLYKGSQLIDTFTVPQVNENGYWQYWRVFDITDGFDPVKQDVITATEPTLDTQNASSSMGVQYYPTTVR